ncbi:MAG TPA: hypothetical protein VNZ22_14885 [Bacillota bacterium]|nr:hypothetical protein [Bacillota bacterium]
MKLNSLLQKIGGNAGLFGGKKASAVAPPVLTDPVRFPYGPFRFKAQLPKGTEYAIQVSTDIRTWTLLNNGVATGEVFEYVDSEAFKFSYRFYRLLAGEVSSANVIGYASMTLPPGFSMIANPFESHSGVGELLKEWPDGTTLNKFDTRLFRLAENAVQFGKWNNPAERLLPGEGAILFNPTSDYKSLSFAGEVMQGNLSAPIPSGFSIRSSLVPQPGNLVEDLGFPIANGDVIHLFDRERQQYVLHPYDEGKWTAGPPVLSVGEAFWVAKTVPGNWQRQFVAEPPAPGN